MDNKLVNINTYDYSIDYDKDDIEDKIINTEYSVFIDSKQYNIDDKCVLDFYRSFNLRSVYIREFIIKINEENASLINDSRFIVCRIKELSSHNNSIIYNTSLLNPDTDIILNKSNFIEPYLTLEAKYVFSLQHNFNDYNRLTLEFYDDKNNKLTKSILDDVFIDIKLNVLIKK